MSASKVTHILRTRYQGATETRGSRIHVTDTMTGRTKSYSYDYAAKDPHMSAALAFSGADFGTIRRHTRSGKGYLIHTSEYTND